MNHLTLDEILNFVSLTELNAQTIELSATVNTHIRKCEKCLELVRAFQMIYDEFTKLNSQGGFKDFITENLSDFKNQKEQFIEVEKVKNFIDNSI